MEATMFPLLVLSLAAAAASSQSFLREPFDQIATVGEHVTLPCRVSDRRGVLQWTRDDFGLGSDRRLDGFSRYAMTGSDDEGKDESADVQRGFFDPMIMQSEISMKPCRRIGGEK